MNLRLLFLYICLLPCTYTFAIKPSFFSTDIQKRGLYGKVKYYRENNKSFRFDEKGRITEEILYNADIPAKHYTWIYDSIHEKTEKSLYDCNGKLISRTILRFQNANIIEHVKSDSNLQTIERETWEYTPNGKKSRHNYYTQTGSLARTVQYDTCGEFLANIKYTPQGEICYQETWLRNAKQQLLENTTNDYKNNYFYRIAWTYDSLGNKTQYERFYKDRLIYKEIYKYDSKGRLIEDIECNPAGNIVNRITYTFNNNGYIIEERTLDSTDRITGQSFYRYDDKGNKTEFLTQNLKADYSYFWKFDKKGHKIEDVTYYNGVISKKETWTYNNAGRLMAQTKYEPRRNTNRQETWKYDKNANRTEYILVTNNIRFKECWKYNHQNQITKYIKFDSEGYKISQIRYKYDPKGNCIKLSEYHRNKLRNIIVREIEYYK